MFLNPVKVIVDLSHTVVGPIIVRLRIDSYCYSIGTTSIICKVITVVPGLIPVTIPPFVTVATPVFDDVHGLTAAGVPEPVNVIVDPSHTAVGPGDGWLCY